MTANEQGASGARSGRRAWSRRLLRRLIWAGASVVPRDRRLIALYGLTESEDGVLALLPALLRRGHHPVQLSDYSGSQHRRAGVRYVSKRSVRGLWTFARAGVVLTSHALYAHLPPLPRQRLVLLWHGEVVKPVGLLDGDEAVPASMAPVCSELGRVYRCAEFGLHPARVPVLGAPRNDRMLTADPAEVRRRLGWDLEARIWVWLPTYRVAVRGGRRRDSGTSANGLPFDDVALARLDVLLKAQGTTLVLKPHPLSEQSLEPGGGLQQVSQQVLDDRGISLYELLAAADGLVTDVSSVWVDYLLTGRPTVFAFPDLDAYRAGRGLNLEPYRDWLPGPLVAEVAELAAAIASADIHEEHRPRRDQLARRFHRYQDAGSSDRLLDLLGL